MTDATTDTRITIDEAATLLDQDAGLIARHARTGRLTLQEDGLLDRADVERFGRWLTESREAFARMIQLSEEMGLYERQDEEFAAQDAELDVLRARGCTDVRITCRALPVSVEGSFPDGRFFILRARHEKATLTVWGDDPRVNRAPEDWEDMEANRALPHRAITVAQDDVPLIRGVGIVSTLDRLLQMLG